MELEAQFIKGDLSVEIWNTYRRDKETWIMREYNGAQLTHETTTVSRQKVDGFIAYLINAGCTRGAGEI